MSIYHTSIQSNPGCKKPVVLSLYRDGIFHSRDPVIHVIPTAHQMTVVSSLTQAGGIQGSFSDSFLELFLLRHCFRDKKNYLMNDDDLNDASLPFKVVHIFTCPV